MSYTESFYMILGVDPDASQQEIKQAYKKAALRTHPDRALPERKADAERDFKRVAEAYEILSEPASRERYNRFGTANSPPPMRSPRTNRQPSPSSSVPNNNNTFFGVSHDKQPFSFQWESSYDSASRAQAQRENASRRPFGGVDPFQLFNEIFEREFASPMHHGGRGGGATSSDLFDNHPFFANHRKMADTGGFGFGSPSMGMADVPFGFDSPFTSHGSNTMAATRRGGTEEGAGAGFGGITSFEPFSTSSMMSSSSSSMRSGGGAGGNYQSESRSTRTINGRTETVIRKVDGQGNETIHTITPNGQQVQINGIEQPNHPLLQQQNQGAGQAALPGPRRGWLF